MLAPPPALSGVSSKLTHRGVCPRATRHTRGSGGDARSPCSLCGPQSTVAATAGMAGALNPNLQTRAQL